MVLMALVICTQFYNMNIVYYVKNDSFANLNDCSCFSSSCFDCGGDDYHKYYSFPCENGKTEDVLSWITALLLMQMMIML